MDSLEKRAIEVLLVLWVLQERKGQQGIRVFQEFLGISAHKVHQVHKDREEEQAFLGPKGEGARGDLTALLESRALRA